MPPTFILILAGVIVAGLLVVGWDMVTRPGRRRKIAAERAGQQAIESQPLAGAGELTAGGWQGPLTDPVLITGTPAGRRYRQGGVAARQVAVFRVAR